MPTKNFRASGHNINNKVIFQATKPFKFGAGDVTIPKGAICQQWQSQTMDWTRWDFNGASHLEHFVREDAPVITPPIEASQIVPATPVA